MTEQDKRAFFEQYAPLAMDQQQKYGIPASVTLAQMALESSWGNSTLAREHNNFFGITAGSSWKGQTVTRTDRDAQGNPSPHKFRCYQSAGESISDHSKILMSQRYEKCLNYISSDHLNWLKEIKAAGYAAAPNYVSACENIIKHYDLEKYDQMALSDALQKGVAIGYLQGKSNSETSIAQAGTSTRTLAYEDAVYRLPVDADTSGKIIASSLYGNRTDPIDKSKTQFHYGIDFSVTNVPVYATESNGKVVATGFDKDGGNYVKIQYGRSDGTKYETTYLHLSQINVKTGDVVGIDTPIAISGNTGSRTTGPHLDFRVKYGADGNMSYINPAAYLAEIEVRSGIDVDICKKNDANTNILAEHKANLQMQELSPNADGFSQDILMAQQSLSNITGSEDPKDWLAYLMGENKDTKKDGISFSGSGDLIGEFIGMMLERAISYASLQYANQNESDANKQKSEMPIVDEVSISPQTLVERERASIDPVKAQQDLTMNFDAINIEQGRGQNQRLV